MPVMQGKGNVECCEVGTLTSMYHQQNCKNEFLHWVTTMTLQLLADIYICYIHWVFSAAKSIY